jgi:hypothetical protein
MNAVVWLLLGYGAISLVVTIGIALALGRMGE